VAHGARDDRARESAPARLPPVRPVPEAPEVLAPGHRPEDAREPEDRGRRPALVVDDPKRVSGGGPTEDREEEVRPPGCVEPGGAHDRDVRPEDLERGLLAPPLARPVDVEGPGRVVRTVGTAEGPVENVVGRDVEETAARGGAEAGERGHAVMIDGLRALRILLRPVDRRPGGGVEHDPRIVARERTGEGCGVAEIGLLTSEPHRSGGCGGEERPAELPSRSEDESPRAHGKRGASRNGRPRASFSETATGPLSPSGQASARSGSSQRIVRSASGSQTSVQE
jgi:hypothetical protein